MDVIVEFHEAAFRHNVSKEDIIHALNYRIHDALIGELPDKYGVIGFDRAWNTLEVIYNPVDDIPLAFFMQ